MAEPEQQVLNAIGNFWKQTSEKIEGEINNG
jgi:hypothetical protein